MANLDRRIHFYSVGFYDEEDGEAVELEIPPVFECVRDTLKPQRKDPSRYLKIEYGNELIMEIVESPSSAPKGSIRGRFGIKRMSGFPRVENAGQYSDLQLAAEAGLAELRHFVVYPKRKLLGIEVNGNAPGISRWAAYLMAKVPRVFYAETNMLIAGDVKDLLKRIGTVRGASLTVYTDQVDQIGELDPQLRTGLKQLKQTVDNARTITVQFDIGSKKRDEGIDVRWQDKLRVFLSKSDNLQALSDVQLRAFDRLVSKTRNIDLLEDRFVGYAKVVTLDEGGRVIDSDSMFSEIDRTLSEQLPPQSA